MRCGVCIISSVHSNKLYFEELAGRTGEIIFLGLSVQSRSAVHAIWDKGDTAGPTVVVSVLGEDPLTIELWHVEFGGWRRLPSLS